MGRPLDCRDHSSRKWLLSSATLVSLGTDGLAQLKAIAHICGIRLECLGISTPTGHWWKLTSDSSSVGVKLEEISRNTIRWTGRVLGQCVRWLIWSAMLSMMNRRTFFP